MFKQFNPREHQQKSCIRLLRDSGGRRHAVWLNSDNSVQEDWLLRLQRNTTIKPRTIFLTFSVAKENWFHDNILWNGKFSSVLRTGFNILELAMYH